MPPSVIVNRVCRFAYNFPFFVAKYGDILLLIN